MMKSIEDGLYALAVRGCLRLLPLFSEPRVAMLPAGHRLAGKQELALADLDGETWLRYSGSRSDNLPVCKDAFSAACGDDLSGGPLLYGARSILGGDTRDGAPCHHGAAQRVARASEFMRPLDPQATS